jgi:hypothetical protein
VHGVAEGVCGFLRGRLRAKGEGFEIERKVVGFERRILQRERNVCERDGSIERVVIYFYFVDAYAWYRRRRSNFYRCFTIGCDIIHRIFSRRKKRSLARSKR